MTQPSHTWRLLFTRGHSGAYNMALDQSILEQVGAGNLMPTLRLYDWHLPCLSLGQAQPADDVDWVRLQERGWDAVRRPTGGKAILHTDEITYSVALPAGHSIVLGDIVTSYRRLSRALLAALQCLGLRADADQRAERLPEGAKGPVCFEVPSDYEITAGGHKLIGSAQVRKYGGVLQHGSLPLGGDITRICDVLTFPDEAARERARRRVHSRATTLSDVLGRAVSWDEAADSLVEAFAAVFDLSFGPVEAPAPAEEARAAELMAAQYAAESWTTRL